MSVADISGFMHEMGCLQQLHHEPVRISFRNCTVVGLE